jgi:hypothetical protein
VLPAEFLVYTPRHVMRDQFDFSLIPSVSTHLHRRSTLQQRSHVVTRASPTRGQQRSIAEAIRSLELLQ